MTLAGRVSRLRRLDDPGQVAGVDFDEFGEQPGPSAADQTYRTHTIAFPASSAGGEAPAMLEHRQVFPTPPGPPGGVPPIPNAGGAPATPEGAR